jgi:hypothetical protein
MKQQWLVFLLFWPTALWQGPLAEIEFPWWVWLLLVGIVLVVIFVVLVLAQEPGPPLEKPKQKDEMNEKH